MVTDDARRYWLRSSFGHDGPFDSLGAALSRAQTLALAAAKQGRDGERPRVECDDGTAHRLPPFGSYLRHDDLARLSLPLDPVVRRERAAVEHLTSCAEEFAERMLATSQSDVVVPGKMKDPAARAIYTWSMRRTALVAMRLVPELRPLADTWEQRWFGAED